MRIALFSSKPFERDALTAASAKTGHDLLFLEERLTVRTAALAAGAQGICAFVNDMLTAEVLELLVKQGIRLIVLRSAGFNHVDVSAAEHLDLTVARVPEYSPHAVAEHTVGLMLCLNRKFHRAYQRVREQNFALNGLLGFDMRGKTVGIVGTGKIGEVVCRILGGFECRLIAFDVKPNPACQALGVQYRPLEDLYRMSDILTLHCPLTPETRHLIDHDALAKMKPGVLLINTSRGGVIDTRAVIEALKSGHLGGLGVDVYEEEADLFFQDLSDQVISDDVFVRLMTFPNVLITAHQAFFTREALENIAQTTIENISAFESGTIPERNLVTRRLIVAGT